MSLATKYRPQSFDEVSEQQSIKVILQQQIASKDIKQAYLFVGPAGCGKTTLARIFANEINEHKGNPIEIDAASNSGVDNVRNIIDNAHHKSLDSEYKVFIIDEAHMITTQGWNAFLKTLEEPPKGAVFIFCTTDPNKIPNTILSRVQRYQINKISKQSICRRLELIYQAEVVENNWDINLDYKDGMEYITKISEGGMRDAITFMDKCLSYSTELTLKNVLKALGVSDYDTFFKLLDALETGDSNSAIAIINYLYDEGKDLKLFIKHFLTFVADVCKYNLMHNFNFINIPSTEEYKEKLEQVAITGCFNILKALKDLNAQIKWEADVKTAFEVFALTL